MSQLADEADVNIQSSVGMFTFRVIKNYTNLSTHCVKMT